MADIVPIKNSPSEDDRSSHNPRMGSSVARSNRLRVLVICFFDPNGLWTVRENILELQKFSRSDIEIANLWPNSGTFLKLHKGTRLERYDVLLFHPTASYNPENITHMDRDLERKFCDFKGVKVLMKQDEQYRSGLLPKLVSEKRIDLVLTCLPSSEWRKVYHQDGNGPCEFMQTLTGYVSDDMKLSWREQNGRPIDVGYRGSLQPLAFGRLGFEKREIGNSFLRHVMTANADLLCDISSRWEDRYSGRDWMKFLQRCRATLGVESGANLFDFTGDVEKACAEFVAANAIADPWSEEYYWNAYNDVLYKYEGNVRYNQVSPRHFEAAATGTVQILYEGEYSDIFKPWKHYVPLRRNYSNFDDVLRFLSDASKMERMSRQAFGDVIESQRYTYRSFVRELDERIMNLSMKKGIAVRGNDLARASRPSKPLVYIVASHAPAMDPRLGWWAESLRETFTVIEIGFHQQEPQGHGPAVQEVKRDWYRIHLSTEMSDATWLSFVDEKGSFDCNVGLTLIRTFWMMRHLNDGDLNDSVGLFGGSEDITRFRGFLSYFFNINSGLLAGLSRLGPPSVLISCDLDTLPACQALAEKWGSALVYDAHEFWPYSLPNFIAGESSFWESVERALVGYAALRLSVSPQLSNLMQDAYGQSFMTLPNAVPKVNVGRQTFREKDTVEFLYQGLFAPGRGLGRLIEVWPRTAQNCILLMRGPESELKSQLRKAADATGLLGSRIIFADAVNESELIVKARESDIGLIPYEPVNINNKYCCPNKLSQYMAAGLPILANSAEYIREVLSDGNCGVCVDFSDLDLLIKTINLLAGDADQRASMSKSASSYYQRAFNWNTLSSEAVQRINALHRIEINGSDINLQRLVTTVAGFDIKDVGRQGSSPTAGNFPVGEGSSVLERRLGVLKEMTEWRGFLRHSSGFLRHHSAKAFSLLRNRIR